MGMNEIMSEEVEKGGKKRSMKRVIVMKGRKKKKLLSFVAKLCNSEFLSTYYI